MIIHCIDLCIERRKGMKKSIALFIDFILEGLHQMKISCPILRLHILLGYYFVGSMCFNSFGIAYSDIGVIS